MTDTWRPFPTGETPPDNDRTRDIEPTRVVLDMDTGVDDAVAIMQKTYSSYQSR